MSAMELAGQEQGECLQRVGGQGSDPAVEGECVLLESRMETALVVAGGGGVDVDVVEHDAVGLLVMLAGAELMDRSKAGVSSSPKTQRACHLCLPRVEVSRITMLRADTGVVRDLEWMAVRVSAMAMGLDGASR